MIQNISMFLCVVYDQSYKLYPHTVFLNKTV